MVWTLGDIPGEGNYYSIETFAHERLTNRRCPFKGKGSQAREPSRRNVFISKLGTKK